VVSCSCSVQMLLFLVIAGTLCVILFLRRNYGKLEKIGIPVIKPTFCFGSGPFKLHKVNFVEDDLENFRKYGPNWGAYAMSEPWLSISDPKIIKQITVKSFDHFSSHYFETPTQKFRTLEMANGEEWKDLRKGLSPTFTSGKIKGMLGLLGGAIDNMIVSMEKEVEVNSLVDVKNMFQKMALDVIAKCAFGVESNSFTNPGNQLLKHGRELMDDFIIKDLPTTIVWSLFQVVNGMDRVVNVLPDAYNSLWKISKAIQRERERNGPGPEDFIDRLIELKQKLEKGDFPSLTADQITGQGIIFLTAGFETTSNTLSTLCYNLVKNEEVMERLVQEIDEALERFDGKVDHETIADMPYLEACIKEDLRMFPPVARNDRVSVKAWEGEGLKIPSGVNIRFPIYVLHHNPEYWPEPELFKPERFLKENSSSLVPYAWVPFGSGPRACIGERFAMTEIKIAMVKMLQKFRLETDETTKIELLNGDMLILSFKNINIRMYKR